MVPLTQFGAARKTARRQPTASAVGPSPAGAAGRWAPGGSHCPYVAQEEASLCLVVWLGWLGGVEEGVPIYPGRGIPGAQIRIQTGLQTTKSGPPQGRSQQPATNGDEPPPLTGYPLANNRSPTLMGESGTKQVCPTGSLPKGPQITGRRRHHRNRTT